MLAAEIHVSQKRGKVGHTGLVFEGLLLICAARLFGAGTGAHGEPEPVSREMEAV